MSEWMERWMDEGMNEWMDGWLVEDISALLMGNQSYLFFF